MNAAMMEGPLVLVVSFVDYYFSLHFAFILKIIIIYSIKHPRIFTNPDLLLK